MTGFQPPRPTTSRRRRTDSTTDPDRDAIAGHDATGLNGNATIDVEADE